MALHPLQLMRNGYPAGRPLPAQPSLPFVSRGLFRLRSPIRKMGVGEPTPPLTRCFPWCYKIHPVIRPETKAFPVGCNNEE